MAAKKTPRAAPTRAEKKQKTATKLGYDSVAAMKSVDRQYGYKQSNVHVNAAQLQAIMDTGGYTANQPVATPINIGGARWMFGAGDAQFTGQRSDAAKRSPGAAYDATSGQSAYSAAGLNAPGKGGKKGKKATGNGTGPGGAAGVAVNASGMADVTGAASTDSFIPYAEADVATTSYKRAQGKAYGQGTGEYLAGQTESPPTETSAVTGEAAGTTTGARRKHPGKKATKKAKAKSSAGGAKVTAKERKTIQRTKARARK